MVVGGGGGDRCWGGNSWRKGTFSSVRILHNQKMHFNLISDIVFFSRLSYDCVI